MSKTSKFLWGLLAVVLLVGIVALVRGSGMVEQNTQSNTNSVTDVNASTTIASTTDTSNAALNQDMSSVNAQLNNLSTDNTGLDTSLQN